jgi:hypothetical protein
MPAPASFHGPFQTYLEQIRIAKAQDQHHDFRRGLFLDLLSKAFDIAAQDIDIEKFIRIDVRKKGWIDALFRNVVFEFKRDLERERADGLRELRDYLKTLPYGEECVGLLTDGLSFEIYILDPATKDLQKTDEFNLARADEETAYLWLDAYLFTQRNVPPTSADIVLRFGQHSPAFQASSRILQSLLQRLSSTPALAVKRQQWNTLLAKVYGSDIGNDTLFIRHTYLNQFAKLLAYASLRGIPRDEADLAGIISGDAFHRFGVSNVGEIDFFSWILAPEVRADAVDMLRRLSQGLIVYDLTRIDEDLLKQLYQDLVDPETRHDLGEFYTPDWLAELTLQEISYSPGQSLLDPSCGSGTFLFLAIRRLAASGVTGWRLVDFALENISGIDVHPLAVTIARINFLLAIIPHMRGQRTVTGMGLAPIPVYLADTLLNPEQSGPHKDTLRVNVDLKTNEAFHIPTDTAQVPALFSEIIDLMDEYAVYPVEELNTGLTKAFVEVIRTRFAEARRGLSDLSPSYWGQNLRLLNELIHQGRNSIWAYMLKNTSRPLILSARKFDVIAGNPPWLSYSSIQDATYQKEVKDLTFHYGLLTRAESKLFTKMELATLFMAHCSATYLRESGTIAFVMPRSVITGAKQHRRFHEWGFTRILDLLQVFPLFNIPSIVLIRTSTDLYSDNIPSTTYEARLPAHQISFVKALPYVQTSSTSLNLVGQVTVSGSYYYDRFKQGATLVPRNLCFVRPTQQLNPGDAAVNPSMETDPDVNTDSKKPWKGISLTGLVYQENLYSTLLSKNLLPFGYSRLHMVALPVCLEDDGALELMNEQAFLSAGHARSWRTWFESAEKKWDELKKDTSQIADLIDRYNYQRLLLSQRPKGLYKVLYNTSGVHLASCVIDASTTAPKVYEYTTQGFIADTKTYYLDTETRDEAHYLCALLNAPVVDAAIKKYQSRGKGVVGERDIHRTPFEACPIPPYDDNNSLHLALAELSKQAHETILTTALEGATVKARRMARGALQPQIEQIDVLAQQLLGFEMMESSEPNGEN